jgi:flavin reductase (DIM6/NTAB) family NADH-FMN oxidoreductase RutF
MSFAPDLQRQIMGRFPTGVALLTTTHDGEPCGMTANSLTSLSLDPPLLLVAIDKRIDMHAALSQSDSFALSLLTVEQEEISRAFAIPGPKDFSDLSTKTGRTGALLLTDALATVECKRREIVPAGDHDIFIGECIDGEVRGGEPLVYYDSAYTCLPPSR